MLRTSLQNVLDVCKFPANKKYTNSAFYKFTKKVEYELNITPL